MKENIKPQRNYEEEDWLTVTGFGTAWAWVTLVLRWPTEATCGQYCCGEGVQNNTAMLLNTDRKRQTVNNKTPEEWGVRWKDFQNTTVFFLLKKSLSQRQSQQGESTGQGNGKSGWGISGIPPPGWLGSSCWGISGIPPLGRLGGRIMSSGHTDYTEKKKRKRRRGQLMVWFSKKSKRGQNPGISWKH